MIVILPRITLSLPRIFLDRLVTRFDHDLVDGNVLWLLKRIHDASCNVLWIEDLGAARFAILLQCLFIGAHAEKVGRDVARLDAGDTQASTCSLVFLSLECLIDVVLGRRVDA